MATSNMKEVFREAVGRKIVGFYDDGAHEHAGTVYVLVLDNGAGLAFGTGNGAHYTVSAEEVERAVASRRAELERVTADLKDVVELARGR